MADGLLCSRAEPAGRRRRSNRRRHRRACRRPAALMPPTALPTPLAAARARAYPGIAHTWEEKDVILYALASGAAAGETQLVYEGDAAFAPLPTFPLVLPYHGVTAAVPFEELVPNFSPVREWGWWREGRPCGAVRPRPAPSFESSLSLTLSSASCTASSTWRYPLFFRPPPSL